MKELEKRVIFIFFVTHIKQAPHKIMGKVERRMRGMVCSRIYNVARLFQNT